MVFNGVLFSYLKPLIVDIFFGWGIGAESLGGGFILFYMYK